MTFDIRRTEFTHISSMEEQTESPVECRGRKRFNLDLATAGSRVVKCVTWGFKRHGAKLLFQDA